MGSAASTAPTPGEGGGNGSSLALDEQEHVTLEELCGWIRAQHAEQGIGEVLVRHCMGSGLSAPELLLHMDQETLLTTLNLALGDEQRKIAHGLIVAGRRALRREFVVGLRELPDAMDKAVYVVERFPLVLDPTGHATRFLKYQRAAILLVGNPADMAPASLRRHLVGALRHGTWLILDFDTLETLELEQFYSPDAFPREILSRHALFRPEVFSRLLRPDEGDPDAAEFVPNDQFKFIVLCRGAHPPPKTALAMCVLRVHVPEQTPSGGSAESQTSSSGDNDMLAKALGVTREIKRNSLELVEAAFDGDQDAVGRCLDQNYDVESADGHGHTALSEAACQGHSELVQLLLERGADPNKLSDEKRSPLYRAAYNGHYATVQILLDSGADPRIASKQSETAFDVAKTDEVRTLLQQWDLTKTERLLEQRRKVIEQRWQERITTHVEREKFALMKIHEELIEMVTQGDAEGVEGRMEQLVDEAIDTGEKRPRASADIRNEQGATLLAIAAQHDHVELVTVLLTKWKVWRDLAEQNAHASASAQQELHRKQLMMANILRANVNARDCRGWTPVAIAVFHESKRSLRLLLDHGADPKLKNQYNKNAFDFAKDDIDAALNVVKSRAEIRQVLIDWENERRVVDPPPPEQGANASANATETTESQTDKSKKKGTTKKTETKNTTNSPSKKPTPTSNSVKKTNAGGGGAKAKK